MRKKDRMGSRNKAEKESKMVGPRIIQQNDRSNENEEGKMKNTRERGKAKLGLISEIRKHSGTLKCLMTVGIAFVPTNSFPTRHSGCRAYVHSTTLVDG